MRVEQPNAKPPSNRQLRDAKRAHAELLERAKRALIDAINRARQDPIAYAADNDAALDDEAVASFEHLGVAPPLEPSEYELQAEAKRRLERFFVEPARQAVFGSEEDSHGVRRPIVIVRGVALRADWRRASSDELETFARDVVLRCLLDEHDSIIAFGPSYTNVGIALSVGIEGDGVVCMLFAEEDEPEDEEDHLEFGNGHCRCCISAKGKVRIRVDVVPFSPQHCCAVMYDNELEGLDEGVVVFDDDQADGSAPAPVADDIVRT